MACVTLNEEQLEYAAENVRVALGYGPIESINGSEFVARYKKLLNNALQIELVADKDLPFAEAEAVPSQNLIKIRQSTYDLFLMGDSRAKMIMIEEICHVMRKHEGTMHRTAGNDNFARANPRKGAQEREAKYLASAIIAPQQAAIALGSREEISAHFGMSKQAASIRFEDTSRAQRKSLGHSRALSNAVIEKLKALEKITGYRIESIKER